jgi:hypothetical protein
MGEIRHQLSEGCGFYTLITPAATLDNVTQAGFRWVFRPLAIIMAALFAHNVLVDEIRGCYASVGAGDILR